MFDNTTGKYLCDNGCPDDGIYIVDSTFTCCKSIFTNDSFLFLHLHPLTSYSLLHHLLVITCEDLGNDVENGAVDYSPSVVEPEGRYKQGTTATVTCDAGFRGGGFITCERSGEWSSPSLPSCEPGESSKKYI